MKTSLSLPSIKNHFRALRRRTDVGSNLSRTPRKVLIPPTLCRLLPVLLLLIAGCGGTEEDQRGVRVGAIGLVTMDDEPLKLGRIVFITDQGNGTVKATAMIQDGSFTFTEDNGPLEGEARVEIHPVAMELEDFESERGGDPNNVIPITRVAIPARYSVRSELKATVSAASGIQPLAFELTSK